MLTLLLLSLSWTGAALAEATPCRPDATLQLWLQEQAVHWRRQLHSYPGIEEPPAVTICRLAQGVPHSRHGQIWLPPLDQEELYLSLAHEYLHLLFRHHPNSRNEAFIEQLARALILGEPPP